MSCGWIPTVFDKKESYQPEPSNLFPGLHVFRRILLAAWRTPPWRFYRPRSRWHTWRRIAPRRTRHTSRDPLAWLSILITSSFDRLKKVNFFVKIKHTDIKTWKFKMFYLQLFEYHKKCKTQCSGWILKVINKFKLWLKLSKAMTFWRTFFLLLFLQLLNTVGIRHPKSGNIWIFYSFKFWMVWPTETVHKP